jgi:hypothetical protein
MIWYGWLSLGFGGGFILAAYIFCRPFRDRVHAVVKGMVHGSRGQQSAPRKNSRPKTASVRQPRSAGNRPRKCFVCSQSSPESEMIRASLNGQDVWLHENCQGEMEERQETFDYRKEC